MAHSSSNSPTHPKTIALMGHSFVGRLQEHGNDSTSPVQFNMGCDINQHIVFYLHKFDGFKISTIYDLNTEGLWEAVKKIRGERMFDLVVLLLGGNDVANSPFDTGKQVYDLFDIIDFDMVNNITKKVAILELPERFSFLPTNRDFRPEVCGKSLDACIALYGRRIWRFNQIVDELATDRENVHVIPIKGLHQNQPRWMLDGIHYKCVGEIKLQVIMKRLAIGFTSNNRAENRGPRPGPKVRPNIPDDWKSEDYWYEIDLDAKQKIQESQRATAPTLPMVDVTPKVPGVVFGSANVKKAGKTVTAKNKSSTRDKSLPTELDFVSEDEEELEIGGKKLTPALRSVVHKVCPKVTPKPPHYYDIEEDLGEEESYYFDLYDDTVE